MRPRVIVANVFTIMRFILASAVDGLFWVFRRTALTTLRSMRRQSKAILAGVWC